MSNLQTSIISGLSFLTSLQSDHPGWYWEVADPNHGDHKIWPQSQHLLYLTFKRLGKLAAASQIYYANDFKAPAEDRNIPTCSRFCVLDNDPSLFYLAGAENSVNFDEVALVGHYWALMGDTTKPLNLAQFLKTQWNPTLGVLGMDAGDKQANLFRVYKTALAGTLFARVGGSAMADCQSTATKLQSLQDPCGGWVTDLDTSGKPNGVCNIETTCLALICLDCAAKGRFSSVIS